MGATQEFGTNCSTKIRTCAPEILQNPDWTVAAAIQADLFLVLMKLQANTISLESLLSVSLIAEKLAISASTLECKLTSHGCTKQFKLIKLCLPRRQVTILSTATITPQITNRLSVMERIGKQQQESSIENTTTAIFQEPRAQKGPKIGSFRIQAAIISSIFKKRSHGTHLSIYNSNKCAR